MEYTDKLHTSTENPEILLPGHQNKTAPLEYLAPAEKSYNICLEY